MSTKSYIKKAINAHCPLNHIKGYVQNTGDNLIEGIDLKQFEDDLKKGSGGELEKKFRALHSSSALAVNNFAIIKKHPHDFFFHGHTGFNTPEFERKFPTDLGGTPPNLDFVLENNYTIITFESKYLEILDKKKVNFSKSYNRQRLKYLDSFWFSLIQQYDKQSLHLDVAQLIKHSVGLINYKQQEKNKHKQIILVYIYWTPSDCGKYPEYARHTLELKEFQTRISKQNEITFLAMTYNQFWEQYSTVPPFKEHFANVKNRYSII